MHSNSIQVLIKKFEPDRSSRRGKKGRKLKIFVQISVFEKNGEKVRFCRFSVPKMGSVDTEH
jgi:hypothetical protein